MSKRFINLTAVEDKTALKKSSIYAKVKTGDFPAPIKMGVRTVWIESEIDTWLDAQVAAWRDKQIVQTSNAE